MPGLNRDPPTAARYYVESTNPHRLAVMKWGHFTAHSCCLRTIVIGRVQVCVAEPASNDCDIDARGEQMYGRGVSVRVRTYVFGRERRHPFRGSSDVLVQLETDTRRAKRSTKAVAKNRLVLRVRVSRHERPEQVRRFWPDGTDTLLAALPNKPDVRRCREPHGSWAEIQDFLNPRARVVQHRQQQMITLAPQR
jgi:hypothetical protein